MALLVKKLIKGYFFLNEEVADPRTNDWPLISSPWPAVTIITAYLFFVFKWGPNFMKNRKPYNIDKIMIIYNITQILLCCYIVYESAIRTWTQYNWFCEPVDYSDTPEAIMIAKFVYLYFWVKIIDLLDTVFFVLRKKESQVSFLHVYHHTGMIILTWAGTKYLAGGHSTFLGTINSFVHIIMYSYYLLTSWDPEYKKSLWWKKHITQLQMIQFFLILVHFLQLLFQPNCPYPKWVVPLFVPQNLFMLLLFADFYRKTYMKKKTPEQIEQQQVENKKTN